MEKTWQTALGEVTLRGAMLDVNGTDLCDGVEIKLDGNLIGETTKITFSDIEDWDEDQVELFVEDNCNAEDIY